MTFNDHLRLIRRIHDLIDRKATGNASQLAARLLISRASVYRYINQLKAMGAPIVYCRNRECFYYKEPFELIL